MEAKQGLFLIGLFFKIVYVESKRFLHYPIELFAIMFNQFISIFLIALFWFIVGNYSDGNLDVRYLVGYYLIIGGVRRVAVGDFGAASSLLKKIKSGELNSYLIKPIGPFFYDYARYIGYGIYTTFLYLSIMVIGVLYSGGDVRIGQLVWSVINLLGIGLAFNRLVASIGFYLIESISVKNSLLHMTRLLQGVLIPLSLIPAAVLKILYLTPFPASLFMTVNILTGQHEEWLHLVIGSLWAVILHFVSIGVWKRSLKKYEAVGI